MPTKLSLSDLDARAREVFRRVVEGYLASGQPMASKTLSVGLNVSPATVRGVMAELSRSGLLASPHTSAGRIPTHSGLRLYIDAMMEVGALGDLDRGALEQGADGEDVLGGVSAQLGALAGGAGLVLAPSPRTAKPLAHVEFVDLPDARTLAVLVYQDGEVENRLLDRPDGLIPARLETASRFLTERMRGRPLAETRDAILAEIASGEAQIDAVAARLIERGLAAWTQTNRRDRRNLVVKGRAALLSDIDADDIARIQALFDDLDTKAELIALLDRTEVADGVRLFIGAENPVLSLSESSLVVAPYSDARGGVIGAVGVIAPTRLDYARVIPMVDYTASLLGRVIGGAD